MSRGRALLLGCIALGVLSGAVMADEEPCTTHADGQYFDLNPLKSSKDYVFKAPSGQEYNINVCRAVATETWAVDKPEVIAGFTRHDHGDFSIGSVNTTLTVVDGHPILTFTDGSACLSSNDLHASTAVRFVCDTSVFGSGSPQLIAQLPLADESACSFFIEWRTHVACPTHEKSSWSFTAIAATIVGIIFMLYIVCSLFHNYFVLQLRGFDLIPQYSFFSFSDTIEFFRSCVDRIKSRSSSDTWHYGNGGMGNSWGRSGGGGYDGLAASHEEGASMLGGPPGFLDEMDDEEEDDPETPRAAGGGEMDRSGVIRL
ncbi:hypothetical protein EIP91_004841 [Steccherinum ochraceum]|uniref:Autophagy-related protein 27 n=1 Tax=Steccherinum ochraceum TaxID=92696 RepID=A0A4R0RSC4_9APHY|nr:hypothetical protein EIP91_004841 [Steccherinum ochraceum]